MDGFDDNLFDVFNQDSAPTPAPQQQGVKRVLTQEKIDDVNKKAKTLIDLHVETEKAKKTKASATSKKNATTTTTTKTTTTTTTAKTTNDTTMTDDTTTDNKKPADPNQLVSLATTGQKSLFTDLKTTTTTNKGPQNLMQASKTLQTSAQRAAQSDDGDVFNGYYEQVVVGSDKPENVQDQTQKTCAMQVCYPPLFDIEKYEQTTQEAYETKIASKDFTPAKSYPFTLDPFQAKAVQCIEKNQSVLVAAHTSAGKTVCAEYAIASSLRLGQRVIYTSPIKALSNQKYRELQAEFKDVGLMTGDVTINPGASCLVMTTEILRNMLYRGSEVLREISWVIFDEVHYMRDRSRGVVWEETIILLPHKCRFVFLSATLLNSAEFASWVAKLHNQPCSVIYTNYRPTPLEHHVFARGSDGIHLVVDKVGDFKDNNFQKALTALANSNEENNTAAPGKEDTEGAKKKRKGNGSTEDEVEMIVRKVKELELDPCIVFSFSKKDCERYAKNMSKVDFCSPDERELISTIFKRAIETLTEEDRKLPQIQEMIPLLKKGIGVHHGGLLPILKEVIELLFQEGLLRVLFSTETFSIGLNMPARTVVFTSMFKWDGLAHRALTSGEYIQMSGRAGRRGLDDKGVVILMLTQEVETSVVKAMMAGPSDPLMSSFRLGYNMLLNLFRLEENDPDYLMVRSFYQFQQQRAVPVLAQAVTAIQKQRGKIIDELREMISKQVLVLKAMKKQQEQQITAANKPKKANDHNNNNNNKKEEPSATTKDEVLKTDYPIIQLQDIQHYTAIGKNLAEQRYLLRKLLHRPEILRQFCIGGAPSSNATTAAVQNRLVYIKGCIREGPPPLIGSAAAMALEQSFDEPVTVNNSDKTIQRLTFDQEVQAAMQQLRKNKGLLDGGNANQNANAGATNMALVRQDDVQQETGIIPPGLGFNHQQLAALAKNNRQEFLSIQETKLKDVEMGFGWGIIVHVVKRTLPDCVLFGASTPLEPTSNRPGSNTQRAIKDGKEVTIFEVLVPVDPDCVNIQQQRLSTTSRTGYQQLYALHEQTKPCPPGKQPAFIVIPVLASAIEGVSTICLKFDTIQTHDDRQKAGQRLLGAIQRLNENAKAQETEGTTANNANALNINKLNYSQYDPASAKFPQMFPLLEENIPQLDLFNELHFWQPDLRSKAQKKLQQQQQQQEEEEKKKTNLLKKDDKNKKDNNSNPTANNNNNNMTTIIDAILGDSQKMKDLIQLNLKISKLHQAMVTHKIHNHPLRQKLLTLYQHKQRFDHYLQWLQYKLQHVSRDETLRATLQAMKRVLRNLQLVTQDDVITNKGRVACELSTCDELVGTELLYSSIFNPLNVKQLAALCSCLVYDEASALSNDDAKPKLAEDLQGPYNQLEEHLKNVATIIKETSIPIDINKYVKSFNPFLMDVIFQWCEGATFATIMKQTKNTVFEGTIVRVMRRLEELLNQFATACETLGNTELKEKFEASVVRLKRDIIFAASLYL